MKEKSDKGDKTKKSGTAHPSSFLQPKMGEQ
jgi:hypothetical protein